MSSEPPNPSVEVPKFRRYAGRILKDEVDIGRKLLTRWESKGLVTYTPACSLSRWWKAMQMCHRMQCTQRIPIAARLWSRSIVSSLAGGSFLPCSSCPGIWEQLKLSPDEVAHKRLSRCSELTSTKRPVCRVSLHFLNVFFEMWFAERGEL